MTLSLRTRFALLTGLLVLTVAALVALGGYLAMRSSLLSRAARSAGVQATRLASLVEAPSAGGGGQSNQVDINDPALTRDLGIAGSLIEARRPSGALVQASVPRGLKPLALSSSLMIDCLRAGAAHARLDRPAVALACRRIGPGSAPIGIVAVGIPLADVFASLTTLRTALLLSVLCGAAVCAALALLLARRATRPIRRIARTAQTIRAGDLGQRIGYRGRDELGELAGLLDACFAELEHSLERQRRFGADASHDLRTPLASIKANVELLRGWAGTDPVARRRAIESIEQASARAARLIEDFLYLATVEREPPSASTPVRLDEVVLGVVRESGHLREGVAIEVPRLDEVVVIGDAQRLAQLLLNVLDNALRISPASSTINVELAVEGSAATVSVSDQGPGIPEDERGRVFDRLYTKPTAPGAQGGSGLGLSIAREIARAHGGDLSAAGNADGGATFTFTLPVARRAGVARTIGASA